VPALPLTLERSFLYSPTGEVGWWRSPVIGPLVDHRRQEKAGHSVQIKLTSVLVDDQGKALTFYTEVLGFVKKLEFPMGRFKWLTVASPEEPNGTQLLLEPNDNPAAKAYQRALFEQGIRATTFFVEDLRHEYERLQKMGVTFTMEPTRAPGSTIAVFEDTCGNLIQLTQLTQV
jgi:predicted enzyme related to lactoylglutathione lyase